MKATKKRRVPAIVMVMGAVALGLGWVVGYQLRGSQIREMATEEQTISQGLNQDEVQTGVSLLGVMEQKYEQGEIGLPQAQQIAGELVSGLTYGPDNRYGFWVETTGGKVVVPIKMKNPGSVLFAKWGWRVGTGVKESGGD